MTDGERSERARIYAVISAICVFSTQFGVTIIAPLLGIFTAASENPYIASSLIFSAFTLVSTPLQIPTGVLSDRFGRGKFIAAGLLLYALASVMLLFFAHTFAHAYHAHQNQQQPAIGGLILARALQGAGAGFFFPAITALLTEITSESKRKDVFSIYNIGLGAGLTLGPIVGGSMTDTLGITSPFILCVALAVSSAALSFRFFSAAAEREHDEMRRFDDADDVDDVDDDLNQARGDDGEMEDRRPIGRTIFDGGMMISCIVIFFGIGVAAIMSSVFSPFAKEHLKFSEMLIGVTLSAMLAVFSILQHAFSMLLRKMCEEHLAALGVIFCASGLASLAFISDPLQIIVASLVIGAGLGAISLSTLTLASKSATVYHNDGSSNDKMKDEMNEEEMKHGIRKCVGRTMGVYYTVFYAGLGIIPLICGYISEIIGAKMVFLLYSIILFAIAPSVWRVRRSHA